ncbi:MAG: SPFH domain-containing protein [Anaerolineales bacterium]|nr:SPFH domain-containing protein [Anaerolineales bacterium]
MARIFDVIEHPSEMDDEIVHRFPEDAAGDFRLGSQVIVRESQMAVFYRDGKALDTFGPGRHTIATANIPLLINLIGKAFNDRSPFTAEVFFVSTREFADEKWGTPQPILVRNPGMGLGVALLQGFGTYSFKVADPQQFVAQIVGVTGIFTTKDIEARLRAMLLSKLQDLLGETAQETSVPELIGLVEELGIGVKAKTLDEFKAIGLSLLSFYIESLKPSERSAEELRAMGMLDMETYTQLQAADAMRDAAQNPSGGAGLTAGIGAGMVIGSAITDSLKKSGSGDADVPAGASGPPPVMTPSEAAAYLKVAEEDVVAAIEAGDITAKKIGKAYRISKESLDEFLSS